MLIIIQKRSIIYLMVLFTIKYIKTERKIAMKTLIVGRTAHGKDYLRKILEDSFGWKFVKSRTTRPPRYEGENTHIFITNEEADNTPESEIIAKTKIGDIRYFATKEDLDNADGYIIDPNGVDYLCEKYKDEWFQVIYIDADKNIVDEKAKERAKLSSDPEKEMAVYAKRCEDEDEQFTQFEAMIENKSFSKSNAQGIISIKNNFDEKEMFEIARGIEMRRRFNQNIRPIINVLIDNGNLSGDKDNDTISLYRKDTDEQILVKTDHLIQALMDEPKNSLFSELMEGYLFREPDK